jgi:hypothetical protein
MIDGSFDFYSILLIKVCDEVFGVNETFRLKSKSILKLFLD